MHHGCLILILDLKLHRCVAQPLTVSLFTGLVYFL
jgi:hypothetical protein